MAMSVEQIQIIIKNMQNTGKWETMVEINGWRKKHKNMSE